MISFAPSYQAPEDGGVGAYGASDANRLRAERRSKKNIRRYCTANSIDRLVTLTFAPPFCTDPGELVEHRQRFIRRLRCSLGHRFPYVWVPELHKDGEKLHAHMGISQFVKKAQMAEVWGHGFVDLRLIRVRGSKNELDHRRRAARYLSKYIGKALDHQDTFGKHRHEVGQGFQPRCDKQVFDTEQEARAFACTVLGGATPDYVWHSTDVEDWQGPPVSVSYWDAIA